MVQKWVNQMREKSPRTGKLLSPKTIRNIWLNLSTAMERAVIEELIKKNSCEHTELPFRERYEAEVYDQVEINLLLSAAQGTDMELPMMIQLCLSFLQGGIEDAGFRKFSKIKIAWVARHFKTFFLLKEKMYTNIEEDG